MQRYYSISTSPTLFGGAALVRELGRIGAARRSRINLFDSDAEAAEARDDLMRLKRSRDYRPDRGL